MTWESCRENWRDGLVPRNECDLHHLVEGMRTLDAPTGPFSIIMASLIRYARMQRVVEIGVNKGGTTVFLADACRDTGGLCIAIDLHPCEEARERLMRLGLESPHCHFHQGNSRDVPYDGVGIDLLFIDGDHSKDGVAADWTRWGGHVKPGGWVFVDNAVSEVGVMAWLADLLCDPFTHQVWNHVFCLFSFGMAIFQRKEVADSDLIRMRIR